MPDRIVCQVTGCDTQPVARGWCEKHYRRWKKHGDPLMTLRTERDGPCSVEDCEEPPKARGYCKKHHDRFLRHGDPLKVAKRGKGALLAELQAAAVATGEECIILVTNSDNRPVARLDDTLMLASRAVWILANGDPGSAHVLHTCHRGEEGCINVRHLKLGDNDQNITDMVQAGRSTRGERSGTHKLKEDQVRDIRRLLADGVSCAALARPYEVSRVTINDIKLGKTWAWLPPESE